MLRRSAAGDDGGLCPFSPTHKGATDWAGLFSSLRLCSWLRCRQSEETPVPNRLIPPHVALLASKSWHLLRCDLCHLQGSRQIPPADLHFLHIIDLHTCVPILSPLKHGERRLITEENLPVTTSGSMLAQGMRRAVVRRQRASDAGACRSKQRVQPSQLNVLTTVATDTSSR